MASSRIDEGLDALMQSVLDGEADEELRAELEARMAEDEQLRAHYDRLRETFEALGSLETIDPPREMRESLLEEIRGASTSAPHPVRRRGTSTSGRRPWRPGARELLAFGAGAAAAALIAMLAPISDWGTEPSENGSSATLLSAQSREAVLDRSTWSAAWGEGRVALVDGTDGPEVRVVHLSSLAATVTLEFDAGQWETVGIEGGARSVRLGTAGRVVLEVEPRSSTSVGLRASGDAPVPPAFSIRVHTADGSAEARLAAPGPGTAPATGTNFDG